MQQVNIRIALTGVTSVEAAHVQSRLSPDSRAGAGTSFSVQNAPSLLRAVQQVEHHEADVVLLGLTPGTCPVLEAIQHIHQARPKVPMVIYLANSTGPATNEAAAAPTPRELPVLAGTAWEELAEPLMRAARPLPGWAVAPETLLDSLPDMVILTDQEGRILHQNSAFEASTGAAMSQNLGRSWWEFVHEDDTAALRGLFDAGNPQDTRRPPIELRIRRADGSWLEAEATFRQVRGTDGCFRRLIALRDVTERHSLEMQFLRVQRLQNIGVLAGGIAHDLNNVLTPVLICLETLGRNPQTAEGSRLIPLADRATRRAISLIQQILAFARGGEDQLTLIRPRDLVSDIRHIVAETFPKTIRYEESIPDSLWNLRGKPTGLHQVLLNLCVNARDAMPEGGCLQVGIENVCLAAGDDRLPQEAAPGRYVLFTVADTGSGIAPELIQRIFDPFFTTKAPGKGTGIGLSTSLGIIQKHNGFVRVTSQPGTGSQFRVFIPAVEESCPHQEAEVFLNEMRGQGELVLVVDDEPLLRTSTRMVLEHHGYRVITAANGREALTALDEHGHDIRVAITDLLMPETDGLKLIESIRARHPQMRIIVTSGYPPAQDLLAESGRSPAILTKPFAVQHLVEAVHHAIHPGTTADDPVMHAA